MSSVTETMFEDLYSHRKDILLKIFEKVTVWLEILRKGIPLVDKLHYLYEEFQIVNTPDNDDIDLFLRHPTIKSKCISRIKEEMANVNMEINDIMEELDNIHGVIEKECDSGIEAFSKKNQIFDLKDLSEHPILITFIEELIDMKMLIFNEHMVRKFMVCDQFKGTEEFTKIWKNTWQITTLLEDMDI